MCCARCIGAHAGLAHCIYTSRQRRRRRFVLSVQYNNVVVVGETRFSQYIVTDARRSYAAPYSSKRSWSVKNIRPNPCPTRVHSHNMYNIKRVQCSASYAAADDKIFDIIDRKYTEV